MNIGGSTYDEFEALFRDEYPRVVAAVRWLASEPGEAEEAAQEAFCRALERWTRVARHERPGAWVQLTALRFAARRRRREARRASVGQPWGPPASLAEVDVDLQRALAALPDGQRVAVVLHHLLDLSIDDAAAIVGVRPGTIKTQLHRARARLVELLGEPDAQERVP